MTFRLPKHLKIAWMELLTAVILFIAMMDMPYGYYTFLKICVCIAGASIMVREYQKHQEMTPTAILFGLVVILFNPIIRIHLGKDIWVWVNFIFAILFAVMAYKRIKAHPDNGE